MLRSREILTDCLAAELSRALVCCRIAKRKGSAAEQLAYLIVAERTCEKVLKLHKQGKIVKSQSILELMMRLEEALSGRRLSSL